MTNRSLRLARRREPVHCLEPPISTFVQTGQAGLYISFRDRHRVAREGLAEIGVRERAEEIDCVALGHLAGPWPHAGEDIFEIFKFIHRQTASTRLK